MTKLNRRRWLESIGDCQPPQAHSLSTQRRCRSTQIPRRVRQNEARPFADFRRKCMLHAPRNQSRVPLSRDRHSHPSLHPRKVGQRRRPWRKNGFPRHARHSSPRHGPPATSKLLSTSPAAPGQRLDETIARFDKTHPDRFHHFHRTVVGPHQSARLSANSKPTKSRKHITAGARGLKILKTLGLYLRENVTEGKLVKIDDPRFDSMWDACGAFGYARRYPRFRPRSFFPAHRRHQRAFRRAQQSP